MIKGLIFIESTEFGRRRNATFTLLWYRSQHLNSRRLTSGICWSDLFRGCCALVLGGISEQVGVEAAECWAGWEHMEGPWGGLAGQSFSNWPRFSSLTGQGLEVLRQDYVVGLLPLRGAWALCCITASFPPLVSLCHRRINLMKILMAWKNFRLPKHGPKSSHIPSLCT